VRFLNISNRRRYYVVGVLAVIGGVLGATCFTLWRLRDNVLDRELEIAAFQARVFEDHLTQSLNVVDLSLANLGDEGVQRPSPAVGKALRDALHYAPYLRSISILAGERIVASSNPANVGRVIAGVSFQPLAAGPVEVIRVGSPWIGRDFDDGHATTAPPLPADNRMPLIPLARDVPADGAWVTMLGALNIDYFLNYQSGRVPAEIGFVDVLRYDGMALFSTDTRVQPGTVAGNETVTKGLATSEIGSFEEAHGGRDMLTAYRASRHHPFVVVVRLDKERSLADWRRQALTTLGLVAAALVAMTLLALTSFRRGERAERERLAALERLRLAASVFDNSIEAIVITTPEGDIVSVNAAFTTITGYTAAEAVGRNPRFLGSGRHGPTFFSALWQTLLATGQWQGEITNRRKDGTIYTEWLIITRVLDEQQRLINYVGVFTDISDAKKAADELRLAAVAFETQEGVMITDASDRIIRVNKAFSEMTGFSAEEAVGQTPALLKSGRHAPAFYRQMHEELRRTGSWQGEIWNRRKNGETYPEWLTITAVRSAEGETTHYVATFSDITQRKVAEDEIRLLAFYDPLTGLPNRRLLIDRLLQALVAGSRSKRHGAILFIDLDNFKRLNDTLGHDIGDLLLQQVGGRLTDSVREGDTVARIGGDEFVIMLEDLSADRQEAGSQAEGVANKVLSAFAKPYLLSGHEHHSTPSIGITLFLGYGETVDELLKRADVAMYQAKAAGRNAVRFFDPEMQAAIEVRAQLEHDMRLGLQQGQFLLHYQAQVDAGGRVVGAEALARWQHPRRELIGPLDFIPLAEETGLILPLGKWVLETACRQLVAWGRDPATAHVTLAVNVSAKQFRCVDFVEQVVAVLAASGANPHRLKLELTESLLLSDIDDTAAKMATLKLHGVGFSLDDFGTGYSSLAYLKRLPLDQIKIDKSFVSDVLTDANDASIARTILALGQSLGLAVIAEGVETREQRDFLSQAGCKAFQGNLFGLPGPAEAIGRAGWS
jgi:diguanylate cyclase (GGDEF)-like protein/PAS domain S-box-containing protein